MTTSGSKVSPSPLLFSSGGEMGQLTREYEWEQTPIGPISNWPLSLRTVVEMILSSKFPMFLWWGSDLIQFYNDAYRPSLGIEGKHPSALGQKGKDCWPEIWPTIYPLIEQVLTTGEATWSEHQLIPIYRNAQLEDVYWTYSYSAIYGKSGQVEGVLVVCNETTEMVRSLQHLKESKEQLLFAIEATELGTWDYNPITNTFTGNDRLKDWFGVTDGEEVDLSHALNAMVENDSERVQKAIQRALEYSSGGLYDIVYRIQHPITKRVRTVRAKGRAKFNEEKIAYRFDGTLEDITDEANAKRELSESEHKLRTLIAEAPIATCLLVGQEMQVELANSIMLSYWGKDVSILQKPLREALPELVGQPFLSILDTVFTTGKTHEEKASFAQLEVKGVLGDYYFDYTYKPLLNESGKVYAIMNMAIDVTETVKASQKLQESESRFRTMAEDSEILIAVADETSNTTYFSQAWVELTGRPLEELLKFGWLDLVHPDDRQPYLNLYLSSFDKKQPFTGEFRIKNTAGNYRWMWAKVPPRFRPDGTFAGYISSCIDITERKEAEKALEEKNTELTRINNDLDNFIYTASHDLKSPVSNLEGLFNTLIEEIELPEDLSNLKSMVYSSFERFKNTIEDLTEISKIQKGNADDLQETSFVDILNEVVPDLTFQMKSYEPKIQHDFFVPSIRFSRKNLRSILYNFISNGIKYSSKDRKPVIHVSTRSEGEFIVLTIKDNGLGIAIENQKKMFQMFKRLHKHVEGTGIGLYIVKRIIDNAGGRIEVESELGKGTTFQVYLKE